MKCVGIVPFCTLHQSCTCAFAVYLPTRRLMEKNGVFFVAAFAVEAENACSRRNYAVSAFADKIRHRSDGRGGKH